MSPIWELDFYSRPILDEQQKKLWELVVCDAQRTFEYSKFCAGAEANARWLQTALEEALELWRQQQVAAAEPTKIRFFRRPMHTIITRACDELNIPAQPSRRTFALNQALQQRYQTVYPAHPGFQPLATSPVEFEQDPAQPLPDALVGQKWRFDTIEAGLFDELDPQDIAFSDVFSLQFLGIDAKALIPGLIIFSPRAKALAGWMSGLELAFLKLESGPPARLLLETGASDRWIMANLKASQWVAAAEAFEAAKQEVQQIHFLAVQADPRPESITGFWLLQEPNLA